MLTLLIRPKKKSILKVVLLSGICLSWFGRPGGVALHSNHQLLGELYKLQTDTPLLCSIRFPLQIDVRRSLLRLEYWQEVDGFDVDNTNNTTAARLTHSS